MRRIDPGSERGMHVLRADRRYRIHEEVSPQTAMELGCCRRHVTELLMAAERGANRGR